jgi:hypothetical protein
MGAFYFLVCILLEFHENFRVDKPTALGKHNWKYAYEIKQRVASFSVTVMLGRENDVSLSVSLPGSIIS